MTAKVALLLIMLSSKIRSSWSLRDTAFCTRTISTFQRNHRRQKDITADNSSLVTLRDSSQRPFATSPILASSFSMVEPILGLAKNIVFGVTGVAGLGLVWLYFNQNTLLYMPQFDPNIPRSNNANPRGYRSPADYNLAFQEHWIRTQDDVEIHSWLLVQPNQDGERNETPTIVFFHGNAGNIGIRLPNAKQMYDELKCNIMLVEYRGYGDSRGDARPTEDGLKLDGEAAVDFIQNHPGIDPTRIVLFGRSLGGAVAFHVAQQWQQVDPKAAAVAPASTCAASAVQSKRQPLAGIIVENTFTSIGEMVDIVFPFLRPFKQFILRISWDSKKIAKQMHEMPPILFLAGRKDEIVPHSHMIDLYGIAKACKNEKARLVIIESGTHNDTWMRGGKRYWRELNTFLKEL